MNCDDAFCPIEHSLRSEYDALAVHPLQSWAWGEFRQQLGQDVVRIGYREQGKLLSVGQVSFHRIGSLPWTVGYFPRGPMPTEPMISALREEGIKHRALFIKLEPNVSAPVGQIGVNTAHDSVRQYLLDHGLVEGKSLFTPFTFVLDLTPSIETLMANLKPKTRYNIRLAQKKGVTIREDNSDDAFEAFQRLTEETTARQHFFAHGRTYRKLMWETMRKAGIARLLTATYEGKILATWVLFFFNGVGYYPYGASSEENRDVMASNLLAWEALLLAKKSGCRAFDFWGSLGPSPDTSDPWYGFHRFKEGYGGTLNQFIGTYDSIISPVLYRGFQVVDQLRWKILKRGQ